MPEFMQRPTGTLEDAIAAQNTDTIAQWAHYYKDCADISMRSLDRLARVLEDIGYVLTGQTLDEPECVWDAVTTIAREHGHQDRITTVENSYKQTTLPTQT
ncbi:hypothetical protein QDT91_28395 (plasmid) [Mycolicibacterium aubagnense]|uniref:hypothetical protein n=1 Tax=Mycolicibacterium aubagnense TaxID=319707 RepID=UPI00244DBE0B|nr:hypothetical protein [Mycolicibacterium aubagnense]WGI35930.1 hypothetical protein QDT91_28395 [Mycolicibacterium aubagnense]